MISEKRFEGRSEKAMRRAFFFFGHVLTFSLFFLSFL